MSDTIEFDYSKEPGKTLKKKKQIKVETKISIITAYYNCSNFIFQTANSVINQTFPNWEWIRVNDGSTEDNTNKVLKKLSKMDDRIKIYNKKNEGPAIARDYGINMSKGEYILILDADDLIDETYMECAYWSLLCNPIAAWSYTDQVGFGDKEYLWTQKFDCEKQKKENLLCICSLIKKEAIISAGGYSSTKNTFHEDWKLWLIMLSKGYIPLKMDFFGFWYRNRNGRLKNALKNQEKRQEALDIIYKLGDEIKCNIEAINYPKESTAVEEKNISIKEFCSKQKKKNILIILPISSIKNELFFMVNVIKRLEKKYIITLITTEKLVYPERQLFEQYSTVFDLTTFIDNNYWTTFINYIIRTRNINVIVQNGNFILDGNIPTFKYIHTQEHEEWYVKQITDNIRFLLSGTTIRIAYKIKNKIVFGIKKS